jgi:hypothetical protein
MAASPYIPVYQQVQPGRELGAITWQPVGKRGRVVMVSSGAGSHGDPQFGLATGAGLWSTS